MQEMVIYGVSFDMVGKQPIVLLKTADGASPTVAGGEVLFTLIGFLGMYFVLGVLFIYLTLREIGQGPAPRRRSAPLPVATEALA